MGMETQGRGKQSDSMANVINADFYQIKAIMCCNVCVLVIDRHQLIIFLNSVKYNYYIILYNNRNTAISYDTQIKKS